MARDHRFSDGKGSFKCNFGVYIDVFVDFFHLKLMPKCIIDFSNRRVLAIVASGDTCCTYFSFTFRLVDQCIPPLCISFIVGFT